MFVWKLYDNCVIKSEMPGNRSYTKKQGAVFQMENACEMWPAQEKETAREENRQWIPVAKQGGKHASLNSPVKNKESSGLQTAVPGLAFIAQGAEVFWAVTALAHILLVSLFRNYPAAGCFLLWYCPCVSGFSGLMNLTKDRWMARVVFTRLHTAERVVHADR